MKYFVLFSGGLDSTFLVWKLLKEGHEVSVFYVDITNNKYKSKIEKLHRELLLEKFRGEFGYDKIKDKGSFEVGVNCYNGIYDTAQPHLWTTAIALSVPREMNRVAIGYVSGDSALSYLSEIRRMYNSHGLMLRKGKLPKMEFPIIKYYKEEIICELPSEYADLTYYCEIPRIIREDNVDDISSMSLSEYEEFKRTGLIYESCGNCSPCQKAKTINGHFTEKAFVINRHEKRLASPEDLKKPSSEIQLKLFKENWDGNYVKADDIMRIEDEDIMADEIAIDIEELN